jgi:hypothetical protein
MANNVYGDHASVGFGVQATAPLGTEVAIPLNKGAVAAGLRGEYINFDGLSNDRLIQLRRDDPEGDIHTTGSLWVASFRAAYGLTEDLSIGFRLPWVQRNDIREPDEGQVTNGSLQVDEVNLLGNSSGLGDVTFFGLYRFYKNVKTRSHVSLLLGFKAPTGDTGNKVSRNTINPSTGERSVREEEEEEAGAEGGGHHSDEFETEHQPGSGSWDGFFGLAYSQTIGPFELDSNVLYGLTTKGSRKTDLGDVFSYNAALSYPLVLSGGDLPCPSCILGLFVEVNGEWRHKNEIGGVDDPNSGGHVVYISPGVRLTGGPHWNIAAGFGYPMVADMNGSEVEPSYRVLSTVSIAF